MTAVSRNPHFWVILALMAIFSVQHYAEQIWPWGSFGLVAYLVLYLIPVVYCGFIFGATAALVTAFTALLIMLPRAVFFSSNLPGALFEAGIVTLIGVLASLMLKAREGKMTTGQDRQIAAETLPLTRNKLHSQSRKVMSYEKKQKV